MAAVNNNVWELGEKYKAAEFAKLFSVIPSKLFGIQCLTKVCQDMSASYDEVIDEQNEYLFEIEDLNYELDSLQEDLEAEIERKEKEISKLVAKSEGKELTEEERAEIESLHGDIDNLTAEINSNIDNKNSEIKTTSEKATKVRTKEVIAQDYGETTLEKGIELAGTEVKGGFFRKLFGRTKALRRRKEAGEAAVKAADELLSKVDESKEIDEKINKYNKKTKVSK